jgi:hypothetical protein
MRRIVVLFAALALTTACAHLRTSRSSAVCEPEKIAASWLAAGPVFRDCEVDQKAAVIEPQVKPKWVPSSPSKCNISIVEFVVDTSGKPEPKSERAVRYTDPGLSVVQLKTVPMNRYVPALKGGQPVRQVVRDAVVFYTATSLPTSGFRSDTSCHP